MGDVIGREMKGGPPVLRTYYYSILVLCLPITEVSGRLGALIPVFRCKRKSLGATARDAFGIGKYSLLGILYLYSMMTPTDRVRSQS